MPDDELKDAAAAAMNATLEARQNAVSLMYAHPWFPHDTLAARLAELEAAAKCAREAADMKEAGLTTWKDTRSLEITAHHVTQKLGAILREFLDYVEECRVRGEDPAELLAEVSKRR